MERVRRLFGPRLALMLVGVSTLRTRHEEGQTLVEYALILALIAILVIVALVFLQGKISSLFSHIGHRL
jgi:Flp pilus assembly pilin Flp